MENKPESATSSVDDILADYAQEKAEFDVTLPRGQVFKFRTLPSAIEMFQIEDKVKTTQEVCVKETYPPSWKPYMPVPLNALRLCVYITKLSVEPKITMLHALKMAHTCGTLIVDIGSKVMEKVEGKVQKAEESAILDEKE